jgi:hypothetical protein
MRQEERIRFEKNVVGYTNYISQYLFYAGQISTLVTQKERQKSPVEVTLLLRMCVWTARMDGAYKTF